MVGAGAGVTPAKTRMKVTGGTTRPDDISDIFSRFWCWLTGGTYISASDIANGNYGASGDVQEPGCDYSSIQQNPEGGGDPSGDYVDNGDDSFAPVPPSFEYTIPPPDPSTGWVNVYTPPDLGCGFDANGNQVLTNDGSCEGQWTTFQLVSDIVSDESSVVSTIDPDDDSWWDDNTTSYPSQSLPTYANMYANYPKITVNGADEDMPPDQVYNLIGGTPLSIYLSNPTQNGNACAARVSRALNYSGIIIPNIPNKTFEAADGKYYFLAASALFDWMSKTFNSSGPKVLTLTQAQGGPNGSNFGSLLSGHKGIYILRPVDPSQTTGFGATGHATLYNGNSCVLTSLGHRAEYFAARGGVKLIRLWILQ